MAAYILYLGPCLVAWGLNCMDGPSLRQKIHPNVTYYRTRNETSTSFVCLGVCKIPDFKYTDTMERERLRVG